MPTVSYRSRNYAGAIAIAVVLATIWIYLAPKSIPMPLELPAHEPIARRATQTSSEPPPGGMRLLPGYTHVRVQGFDSELGRIARLGGPVISYEIGGFRYPIMQGVDGDRTVLWIKSQKVYADAWMEGRTLSAGDLHMVMRNDGRLDIDTGLANFTAERVRTTEDLAEALLMAVTLDAEGLNRERGLGIKWTYAPVPRAMKLLPGYVHTPRGGIDTEVGDIAKNGGPDIGYKLHGFRADLAGEINRDASLLWRKTQTISGHEYLVAMRDDGRLSVVTPAGNFAARNVRTQEDVADVLLMLLTFDNGAPPTPSR